MTDQEIIQGLIARDNRVTEDFFFVRCRPLFLSIIRKVYDYEEEYNECVNELYLYLMTDNARKLRNFEYRSTLYQWLKVVAIRFFLERRKKMIETASREPLYEEQTLHEADESTPPKNADRQDLDRLFSLMSNKRYVFVIQRLIIEDAEPEKMAAEMGITVDNLYNIKRRAMAQLTRVALNDIRVYEKQ
mgnify:CR=1 FL=1